MTPRASPAKIGARQFFGAGFYRPSLANALAEKLNWMTK
jgi:hypothetical protein